MRSNCLYTECVIYLRTPYAHKSTKGALRYLTEADSPSNCSYSSKAE